MGILLADLQLRRDPEKETSDAPHLLGNSGLQLEHGAAGWKGTNFQRDLSGNNQLSSRELQPTISNISRSFFFILRSKGNRIGPKRL